MKVYFRADGNSHIGLGHIVRCGALAQMIKAEFECVLLTKCNVPSIIEEASQIFSIVIQFEEDIKQVEEINRITDVLNDEDVIILDGYHFHEDYQMYFYNKGFSIVCIDDLHSYAFKADIIINSAGGVKVSDYNALPYTQFYLGPAYSLLRAPFLKKDQHPRITSSNKNVFICFGGADPYNATLEALQSLNGLAKFEKFYVVVGSGYSYYNELQDYISEEKLNVTLFKGVNANQLVNIMSECSYAVCSASTVSYEYMSIGGVIYLKQTADNQSDMINYLVKEGYAFLFQDLGKIKYLEEIKSLEKQAGIFDGKAGDRLKAVFEKIVLSKKIIIRKVRKIDLMLCYEWANDRAVRDQSFNTQPIIFSNHEAWFESKLQDSQSFFYILELDGMSFAQIRFQVDNSTAVLSYLIDKNYRNKGLGTILLAKGIKSFVNDYKNKIEIVGYVKFSNIASQRSFEKLNFNKEHAGEYEDTYKYTMQYD